MMRNAIFRSAAPLVSKSASRAGAVHPTQFAVRALADKAESRTSAVRWTVVKMSVFCDQLCHPSGCQWLPSGDLGAIVVIPVN